MSSKTEKWVRWIGIFVIGTSLPLTIGKNFLAIEINLISIAVSIFYTGLYWNINAKIVMGLRQRFPSYQQTKTRIFHTLIAFIVATLSAWFLLDYLIWDIAFHAYSQKYGGHSTGSGLIISFALTISISTLYETVYFFEKWKEAILETEMLKHRQIQSQLEVLKAQVNPHFLFNSLNTLTALIAENPEKAIDFTENLAEVYRYILQNREKSLISLQEEWEFTKSYIFLLKSRFGENIHIHTNFQEENLQQFLPPLTLQMLLENCIKHNVISKQKPLFVDIYSENQQLTVYNNLQPKLKPENSTGLGLANLQAQYQYISQENLRIEKTEDKFIVKIPLITLHKTVSVLV